MADPTDDRTSAATESHHAVDSVSGALRLIWVRLGRWIAYALLIISTLIVSYVTGRHFFEKAGYARGFRAGHASMSFFDTLWTREAVADSIRDDARNSALAQVGVLDYLRLAAYPRNKIRANQYSAEQWLVARFEMIPASQLVNAALTARPTHMPAALSHYVDEIDSLYSDEWPALAADIDLETVSVPRFDAISPVVQYRWCYAGADRLHYVVEP